MKIGIFSDLHLHTTNPYQFEPDDSPYDLENQDGVFYINAGDVSDDIDTRRTFLEKHQNYMFSVMGNHDYYHGEFPDPVDYMSVRQVGDIKIAGATLWTDVSNPMHWLVYKNGLIDTTYIDGITQEKMQAAHVMHRDFLFNSGADIIVSHHCPSSLSVAGHYKGDPLNPAFYTDYTDMILNMTKPPKLWIHGHTHDEFDYMIGSTRVICHPRGYRHEKPWYMEYKPKIVEI